MESGETVDSNEQERKNGNVKESFRYWKQNHRGKSSQKNKVWEMRKEKFGAENKKDQGEKKKTNLKQSM